MLERITPGISLKFRVCLSRIIYIAKSQGGYNVDQTIINLQDYKYSPLANIVPKEKQGMQASILEFSFTWSWNRELLRKRRECEGISE